MNLFETSTDLDSVEHPGDLFVLSSFTIDALSSWFLPVVPSIQDDAAQAYDRAMTVL